MQSKYFHLTALILAGIVVVNELQWLSRSRTAWLYLVLGLAIIFNAIGSMSKKE